MRERRGRRRVGRKAPAKKPGGSSALLVIGVVGLIVAGGGALVLQQKPSSQVAIEAPGSESVPSAPILTQSPKGEVTNSCSTCSGFGRVLCDKCLGDRGLEELWGGPCDRCGGKSFTPCGWCDGIANPSPSLDGLRRLLRSMADKALPTNRAGLASMYENAAKNQDVLIAWEEGRLSDVVDLGRQHAMDLSQRAFRESQGQ